MAALPHPHRAPITSPGPRSDKYFIEAVCQKTGGDYAYADANEEGLSQIRAFLLKHCAAEFNKVATKCYLEIECAKGVAITQVTVPRAKGTTGVVRWITTGQR